MPKSRHRYALLTEDSGRRLDDQRRRLDAVPLTRYRTPEGLTSPEGLYAEITVNNADGSYRAKQVEWNAGSWQDVDGGVTWDSTPGGPGYLYGIQANASYDAGTVVHAWSWGDVDGTTVWLFDELSDDITRLCYGSWDLVWDVSPGSGCAEGELNVTDGYTYVYVHRIDADGSWQAEWLAQFKPGDIVKISDDDTGIGVLFAIVSSTLTGDYYTWEIDVCDISSRALITTPVSICIGLTCTKPDDVDIDEGPGIEVVESPNDNFKISALLSAGTCITLNDPGNGEAYEIAVDVDCVSAAVDWTAVIAVCDSIEWQESPGNCIHLVGDEAAPPEYTFYAYADSLAPRGWHYIQNFVADTDTVRKVSAVGNPLDLAVACQYSIDSDAGGIKLVNDENSPANYKVYCKTTGNKGWDGLLNFFVNTSTVSWSGGSPNQLQAAIEFTASSSVTDNTGVELYGDESAPGNYRYYGTDSGGTKGWEAFTQITVVTGLQVDGANNELEYKYRTAYVAAPSAESGWTVWHTGTDCS